MPRLVIHGLGPAGAVLAIRAAMRGWDVTAYDPRAHRPWPGTYLVASAEIPQWAQRFFYPPARQHVITDATTGRTTLPGDYQLLDADALRRELDSWEPAMQTGSITVVPKEAPTADAAEITVDCRGVRSIPAPLWQLAQGVVLPTAPPGGDAILMDWTAPPVTAYDRAVSDAAAPPSFLYVQKVPEGWLYEETILATTTPFPPRVARLLRHRLRARLARDYGIPRLDEAKTWEAVIIPMGSRRRPHPPATHVFGSAAGFIHPATGFSVGRCFADADAFLDSLPARDARGIRGTRFTQTWGALRAAANRELAYQLRLWGGHLISVASQDTLGSFFAAFFRLPQRHQQAYLLGTDGFGVARAMWALRPLTGLTHPFLTGAVKLLQPRLRQPGLRRRD